MTSMYQMIRNAHVQIQVAGAAGKETVHATIEGDNGRFEHLFNSTSRVSAAVRGVDAEIVQQRLNGGSYFFVQRPEGATNAGTMQLVDFRDSAYNGFAHSDENIKEMMERIGTMVGAKYRRVGGNNTVAGNIVLGSTFGAKQISIPQFNEGGNFNSRLLFSWNPFQYNIRAAFELIRLICTNGMVGMASFLNAEVPIIGNWEEHLTIASTQIQNKVDRILTGRLSAMGEERASVADLALIAKHASIRMDHGVTSDQVERERARRIAGLADPSIHLRDVYQENVFDNSATAARVPGHMTKFDAWNMATELASHTGEGKSKVGTSTDNALHALASRLVFGSQMHELSDTRAGYTPPKSAFSSAERAFFGA